MKKRNSYIYTAPAPWRNLNPAQGAALSVTGKLLILKIIFLVILTFLNVISYSQEKEWKDALLKDSFIGYFSYAIDYPNCLNKSELYDSLYSKLGEDHYQVLFYYQPSIDTTNKIGYELFLGTISELGDYHDNNIFEILVTKEDSLFFEIPEASFNNIKDIVIKFLENPNNDTFLSEQKKEFINGLGEISTSKGMFWFIGDLNPLNPGNRTSWSSYLNAFYIIRSIIEGLRNDLANKFYLKSYNELNIEQKSSLIEAQGLGCLFFFTVPEWYKIN